MKFYRQDSHIIKRLDPRDQPIDKNDPANEHTAIEYAIPEGFSWKAKATMNYLDGTAFIYEYKDQIVLTDESLYLTAHGDGTMDSPIGFPRGTFAGWDELERWLEMVYDEEHEDWDD